MLVEGETPVDKVKRDADLLAAEEEEEEEDEVGAWPWPDRAPARSPSPAVLHCCGHRRPPLSWVPSSRSSSTRRSLRKAGAPHDTYGSPVPLAATYVPGLAADATGRDDDKDSDYEDSADDDENDEDGDDDASDSDYM